MFGQFSEHMKKSTQPVSELFAANMKAMEAVAQQQSEFFSGLLSDSAKLVQTLSQQTEAKDMLAVQSVYAETVRERLTSASKSAYEALNSVTKQYSDALNTVKTQPVKKADAKVSNKVAPATAKTNKTATTKKTVAKKPAVKTAVNAKTVTKAATKPIAKLSADEVKAPIETKSADTKSTAKPVKKA